MDYGMYTDNGNQMIGVLVNVAKTNDLSFEKAYDMLQDISKISGFEEAMDTVVRENFLSAIGYY